MSAPGPFRIEPLSVDHDRAQFTSGSAPLDRYFREQASQDIKRRIATCFVALSLETQEIAGFYTPSLPPASPWMLWPLMSSKSRQVILLCRRLCLGALQLPKPSKAKAWAALFSPMR
jgi:hypothetical protein